MAATLCLALVCASLALVGSDPLSLGRLVARLQAARVGAHFLGRDGLVLQSGLHDCGPAALANLLWSVGREPPPLDSLARAAGTGPSGTHLSGLVTAAEWVGLPLVRWSPGASPEAAAPGHARERPLFPLPAIAWVHQDHFVTVVSRAADGRLTILDPLVGRYSLSSDDFRRIWLGEVLLVLEEPSPFTATSVASSSPLAGGFHAKSLHRSTHPDPGRRIRHASSPRLD